MMTRSKKANARSPPEEDPPRRVRPCLNNDNNYKDGKSGFENPVTHDHDYVVGSTIVKSSQIVKDTINSSIERENDVNVGNAIGRGPVCNIGNIITKTPGIASNPTIASRNPTIQIVSPYACGSSVPTFTGTISQTGRSNLSKPGSTIGKVIATATAIGRDNASCVVGNTPQIDNTTRITNLPLQRGNLYADSASFPNFNGTINPIGKGTASNVGSTLARSPQVRTINGTSSSIGRGNASINFNSSATERGTDCNIGSTITKTPGIASNLAIASRNPKIQIVSPYARGSSLPTFTGTISQMGRSNLSNVGSTIGKSSGMVIATGTAIGRGNASCVVGNTPQFGNTTRITNLLLQKGNLYAGSASFSKFNGTINPIGRGSDSNVESALANSQPIADNISSSIGRGTGTPILESTYPRKDPEISLSVASTTSGLSGDKSNFFAFSGPVEKIGELETNFDDECKKAFNALNDIKKTFDLHDIELNDVKHQDTSLWNVPYSSKMADFIDGKQTVEDDSVSFIKDEPTSDDNLSPDVCKLLSGTVNSSDVSGSEAEEEEGFGTRAKGLDNILEAFAATNALTARGLHNLQDSLSRCPDESEYAEDPKGLTVPLMWHQKKALKWLIFRENERSCRGGILADDMGLGKTLTMISLIVHSLPPARLNAVRFGVEIDDSDDDWDLPSNIISVSRGSRKNTLDGGTLIVCPPTLLDQWKNEIIHRTVRGLLSVKVHHGNNMSKDPRDLCKTDIVITTYSLLYQDLRTLTNVNWKRVVLDEAHYIRNPETNVSKAACELKAEKRWAMTGTPVHNKPLDIYALIKFLGCSPWDDKIVWNKTMRGTRAGIVRLTTVLKSLVLRRTKAEMQASGEMLSLPDKIFKTVNVELDDAESEVYTTLLKFSQTLFAQFLLQRDRRDERYNYSLDQFVHKAIRNRDVNKLSKADIPKEIFDEINKAFLDAEGDIQQYHILVLLLRLRQICNHPALINKMIEREEISQQGVADEDESAKPGNLFHQVLMSTKIRVEKPGEETIRNPLRPDNPVFDVTYESSKIKAILETVRVILPTGEKIVLVSQWTSMLEVIEWHLSESGETRYIMFNGKVKVQDRQGIVDCFNDPRNDLKILLLSLTAGGVGLNLFGGNHLLMIDNHWNPQLENQAEDRIHRQGQKKEVTIYRFLCQETIEERVKELQQKKLQLARDILSGIRLTSTKLSLQNLQHLFNMR